MISHKPNSQRTRAQTATTQPEIPAQPLAEKPITAPKKKNSTMPSPGSGRKSQRGRYAVHEDRLPKFDIQAAVKELSPPSPADARSRAAKKLKAHVTDAEKARDVLSILPPANTAYVSSVREHCIEFIRKEIR